MKEADPRYLVGMELDPPTPVRNQARGRIRSGYSLVQKMPGNASNPRGQGDIIEKPAAVRENSFDFCPGGKNPNLH